MLCLSGLLQQESADLKASSAGSARSSCFEFPPKEVSVSVNFQKKNVFNTALSLSFIECEVESSTNDNVNT